MSTGYPVNLMTLITGENQSLGALEVIDGIGEYETVAASQTNQVLGGTGAAGDYLGKLVCVVSTATSAQVQIKDGANAAITVLPAGVPTIGTYVIPLGIKSTVGAWQVSTGANVAVVAIGAFT
jgi:hypothetical protein